MLPHATDFLVRVLKTPAKAKAKVGMYLKNALKNKTTMPNMVDKIRELASEDASCKKPLGTSARSCFVFPFLGSSPQTRTAEKIDAIIAEIDREYEQLAELQADGNTTGYTDEFFG